MTFLKIIRHNIKLFFLSLLLNLAVLQGQTPINTIVLADFPFNGLISGENPVYCQAFNAELDILALSVKNRIIIWNGHSIKEFICKGNAFLEINKSGEVYFLTKSEFGVIRDSKKANSSIFKFSEGVHENEFSQIIGIKLIDEVPFLIFKDRVAKYDGKSVLPVLTFEKAGNYLRTGGTELYFYSNDSGLNCINPKIQFESSTFSFFKGKNPELVIDAGNKRYILDSEGELYSIQSESAPILIMQLPDDYTGRYTSGIFSKNKIIIGSENKGLAIIDLISKEVSFLSRKNGLESNAINDIYSNRVGFLLVIHPDGISRIANPFHSNSIDYTNLTNSKLSRILVMGTDILLSSADGIFRLEREKHDLKNGYYSIKQSLIKIPGCEEEVREIIRIDKQFFFITASKILLFRKDGLSKVYETHNPTCVYQPQFDSSLLILGKIDGFQVLKYGNSGFKNLFEKSGSNFSTEAVSETSSGRILIKTENNHLFSFSAETINGTSSSNAFTEIKTSIFNTKTQFHFSGGNLYLYTGDSAGVYNRESETFQAIKFLSGAEHLIFEPVSTIQNSDIWLCGKTVPAGITEGIYQLSPGPEGFKPGKAYGIDISTANSSIQFITSLDGKVYYLTNNNLVIINDTNSEREKLHMQIEIEAGRQNFLADNFREAGSGKIILSHTNNFLRANFSVNYPESEKTILYRFQLAGNGKTYSNWSYSRQANFNRLSAGNYVLKVEARSIDHTAFAEVSIAIHINLPYYLKWYMILIYIFLIFSGIIIYVRWKSYIFLKDKIKLESIVSQRTEELQNEKEKSEQLLANILPKDTADELKKKGKASSQKYELVTVLFSDIQGFTKIAEQMNPEALIDQLDNFYFHFDSVVEKYNIEKIKTIGDAYMCAGGIPEKNRTNPVEVVLAALEVQDYMKELKKKNSDIWDVRIGVHTGPVIAGVIGHKKFSYDIWGDTVNTASRMESSGEASKINISGHTYELVKDFFICEYRGKMPVKYKGEIDMYFVKGIRPELSVDLYRIPNKNFFIHLQKLRLVDIEEFVFQTFETEVSSKLYFHNNRHTMEVYSLVELLGRAEGISEEELLMVRTAALMSDTGFLSDYNNHSVKSVEFAKENLSRFKYSENQIQQVIQLLQSNEKVNSNSSLAEKIMADAQTVYFGRVDFTLLAENFYKELSEMQLISSREAFINKMSKTLREHQYFTESAKRLKEIAIEEQLEQLKKLA